MPKVSIIMPVYNAEKTIEKTLNAIVAQTFKDFEVICIDDGSKDNSFEILKNFAQKDSRFIVSTQENSGPAKTRYNAIEKSCGEYLMFCDADDWYEPTMIEKMYNTITKKNVDLVMCDCNVVDLADETIQNKKNKNYHNLKIEGFRELDTKSLKKINVVLWNKIFKKEILDMNNIKYPKEYEHDDTIFFYKYLAFCKTYYGIKDCLYNYVVGNPESIMGKVYTQQNTKNPYDFIYAWENFYNYITNQTITAENFRFFIIENYNKIKTFYEILSSLQQQEAFTLIKNFIEKYPITKNYVKFEEISKIEDFSEFHQFMTKKEKQKISFLQHIFSIKNDDEYKNLRILGIKIRLKKL